MNWFNKASEKFKKQSKKAIMAIMFTKFLFGVGLGVLLTSYWWEYDWKFFGWLMIIIALILHLPSIYAVLIKK